MQTNIASSIQDYCKKINRRLSFADICSLFLTLACLLALNILISEKQKGNNKEIIYNEGNVIKKSAPEKSSNPFGSRNGKTYTFSWCSGSKNISIKNKVYFSGEDEAKATGRTLSKLCKK